MEPNSEDFLFHLYRGSEMLRDDRVHDAKEELEAALRLQPRDPKSQDLLAVVYFRLGMYPRAIEIFQELIRAYPQERIPRVNLALCLLKTGQAGFAKQILEETVMMYPDFQRAWGYLGLAHERLRDPEKAREAFLRAGQEGMAKRMEDQLSASRRPETDVSLTPLSVRPSAASFHEIEPASLAAEAMLRADAAAQATRMSLRPPALPEIPPVSEPPSVTLSEGALDVDAFVSARSLTFPREATVAKHTTGLIRLQSKRGITCRGDAVRIAAPVSGGSFDVAPAHRMSKGHTLEEILGGALPLFHLGGAGYFLLGPRLGRKLDCLMLDDRVFWIRESALVAFDESVRYENFRLAVGDGEVVSFVRLTGPGGLVVEIDENLGAIDVRGSAVVSLDNLIAWVGKLQVITGSAENTGMALERVAKIEGEGQALIQLS